MIGAPSTTAPRPSSSAGEARPSATSPSAATGGLGQADFLRLMSAQLSAQDPFEPMDNSQFLAQLAQFSQVAGIAEMNASLTQIAANIGGGRFGDPTAWLGREVLASGDIAAPGADGNYSGEIDFQTPSAPGATLAFVDGEGRVLARQPIGGGVNGRAQWGWDGRLADGSRYTGPVQLVIEGNGDGQTGIATWTRIEGVRSPTSQQALQLVTPLGVIAADQVVQLGR